LGREVCGGRGESNLRCPAGVSEAGACYRNPERGRGTSCIDEATRPFDKRRPVPTGNVLQAQPIFKQSCACPRLAQFHKSSPPGNLFRNGIPRDATARYRIFRSSNLLFQPRSAMTSTEGNESHAPSRGLLAGGHPLPSLRPDKNRNCISRSAVMDEHPRPVSPKPAETRTGSRSRYRREKVAWSPSIVGAFTQRSRG